MAENPTVSEYRIECDKELRFEVPLPSETGDKPSDVVVELLNGTAEIFGTELLQHKRYTFGPGARVAIYTWHGCTVELVGQAESPYIARQTPMVIYLNTHAALEQSRQHVESEALSKGPEEVRGPRIMIAGPADVGKSTYCRYLLNYAVRQGRSPIFVDLDVSQGSNAVPGSISALLIERPADPVDGFQKRNPLVYHFGHLSPGDNMPLFNVLVSELAEKVNQKCRKCPGANISGVVINTSGWVKGDGYACLVNAAEKFEIDVVVVLDHERLYTDLQRDLPPIVKILHQPKSGGVDIRDREMRQIIRRNKIRTYFYGGKTLVFPHSFEVPIEELTILKIGAPQLPESCLPLGMKPEDHRTKVVSVSVSPHLKHHILGVSQRDSVTDDVVTTNVAGFVCVADVRMDEGSISLLSPQPHPLPSNILIYGDISFLDDQ